MTGNVIAGGYGWTTWQNNAKEWVKKWFTLGEKSRIDNPDAELPVQKTVNKYKRFWPKAVDFILSLAAALGTGLSVFFGCYGFGSKLDFGEIASYIFSVVLGVASWFANQSINDVAFDDFHKYAKTPFHEEAEFKIANLKNKKSWIFYFGVFLFCMTAVMYGASAFVLGEWGPLEQIALILGLISAVVGIIPELENWVDPYYHKSEKGSIIEYINGEKSNKWALIIAILNVIAVSITFAIGLIAFSQAFMPGAAPIIVIALSIGLAFSIGGFCEFYFNLKAISDFFAEFTKVDGYRDAFKAAPIHKQAYVFSKVTLSALGNVFATLFAINWILPALIVGTPFAVLTGPYLLAFAIVCAVVSGIATFLVNARFCGRELITQRKNQADYNLVPTDNPNSEQNTFQPEATPSSSLSNSTSPASQNVVQAEMDTNPAGVDPFKTHKSKIKVLTSVQNPLPVGTPTANAATRFGFTASATPRAPSNSTLNNNSALANVDEKENALIYTHISVSA